MFCPSCGKEISYDSNYCPYCGAKISKTEESSSSSTTTPGYGGGNDGYIPDKKVQSDGFTDRKNAIIAGILALFVGAFGIHNFYLKKTSRAILQLILTLLVGTAVISVIWSFVEGIMLLVGAITTDGDGNLLSRSLT